MNLPHQQQNLGKVIVQLHSLYAGRLRIAHIKVPHPLFPENAGRRSVGCFEHHCVLIVNEEKWLPLM